MGDAHSYSGLPTCLRLEKVEEILVVHDLAVGLRELRVAIHSLGFKRCQTGLRVVGPMLERLGRLDEVVHVNAVSGTGSANVLGVSRCRWLRLISPWAMSLATEDLDAAFNLHTRVVGVVHVDTLGQAVSLGVHPCDGRVGLHEGAFSALDALL